MERCGSYIIVATLFCGIMSIREILCRKAPVSKWLPAACMVLLLFSACKKSNSGAAAVAAPLRIKTEITIENNVADTITYYYDANWRQIRSSAASQHITDVFISDTLINTVSYLGRAYPYSSSLYRISAQGLASSRASSSYDGVNYHDY